MATSVPFNKKNNVGGCCTLFCSFNTCKKYSLTFVYYILIGLSRLCEIQLFVVFGSRYCFFVDLGGEGGSKFIRECSCVWVAEPVGPIPKNIANFMKM